MTRATPEATSTGRRTRGGYSNGDRRRSELIDLAMALFAEQGYSRLSLRQIADALGTSHTALRYHFPQRENLLLAVLERRAERDLPYFAEEQQRSGALTLLSKIMDRGAELPGVVQLDTALHAEAMQPDHPAHAYMRQRDVDFTAAVRAGLEADDARGRLRPGLDLAVTARQITTMIDGLNAQWLYDPTIPTQHILSTFIDTLRA